MRKGYDFSKSGKIPYAKQLKKQITIRLGEDAITYFKKMSKKNGITAPPPIVNFPLSGNRKVPGEFSLRVYS